MREDHSTFFHLSEISYPSLYMSMQLMKICFWKDLPIAFHEYVIFAEIWVHRITLWVTTYLPSASHIGSWCWLGTNFFVHSKCASTWGWCKAPSPSHTNNPMSSVVRGSVLHWCLAEAVGTAETVSSITGPAFRLCNEDTFWWNRSKFISSRVISSL